MDLDLTPDQTELLAALDPLLADFRELPQPAAPDYFVYGAALDSALADAGYYGDADGFVLSPADAALMLQRIAQSPYCVPAMASMIVAPALPVALSAALPRPLALVSNLATPARFLAEARTALVIEGERVLAVDLSRAEVVPATTLFAYPYARLAGFDRDAAQVLDLSADQLRTPWRLGVSAEILGALEAAHALTVDYVKQRQQFKRALGSFQAIQHRLGEAATHIEALRLLLARAAIGGDAAEIAIAACYAQKQVAQTVYDCHQFHGAMGLTLEYVLHHWTYRLKVLAGELGGSAAQGRAASQLLWATAA